MLEMNIMITMALKFVRMTLNMMVELMEQMKVMILKQFAKINLKQPKHMRHFMDLNLLVNKIQIQMNHLREQMNLINFELKVNSKPRLKMSFLMVLMKMEKLSYSIVQQMRENHQRFIKIHYFLEMSFPLFLSLMLFQALALLFQFSFQFISFQNTFSHLFIQVFYHYAKENQL